MQIIYLHTRWYSHKSILYRAWQRTLLDIPIGTPSDATPPQWIVGSNSIRWALPNRTHSEFRGFLSPLVAFLIAFRPDIDKHFLLVSDLWSDSLRTLDCISLWMLLSCYFGSDSSAERERVRRKSNFVKTVMWKVKSFSSQFGNQVVITAVISCNLKLGWSHWRVNTHRVFMFLYVLNLPKVESSRRGHAEDKSLLTFTRIIWLPCWNDVVGKEEMPLMLLH